MFDINSAQAEFKKNLDTTVENCIEEMHSIRSGKASPAMVENIMVEAYGGSTKLKIKELATIATEGPTTILISPFDPTTTAEIERAILKSPLNLSPRVDNQLIHITIPPLSEEQRKVIMKVLSEKIEAKRSNVRGHRDEIRKKIKQAFEGKEITQDEKFRYEKEIDKITKETDEQIDQIKQKKEKEIMEV